MRLRVFIKLRVFYAASAVKLQNSLPLAVCIAVLFAERR